jgi:hypothetical protein
MARARRLFPGAAPPEPTQRAMAAAKTTSAAAHVPLPQAGVPLPGSRAEIAADMPRRWPLPWLDANAGGEGETRLTRLGRHAAALQRRGAADCPRKWEERAGGDETTRTWSTSQWGHAVR